MPTRSIVITALVVVLLDVGLTERENMYLLGSSWRQHAKILGGNLSLQSLAVTGAPIAAEVAPLLLGLECNITSYGS